MSPLLETCKPDTGPGSPRVKKISVSRPRVRAMTLIELLAVVTIIGIVSAVVIGRLGSPSIGNPGARATARRLALDLRHARVKAIAEGTNHYVGFDVSGSDWTGYSVYRVDSPTDVPAESYRALDRGITITGSGTRAEFNPAGEALAGYTFTVAGPTQNYSITVIAATGAITVSGP